MQFRYFKTELRIFRTKKFYYLINIIGLALGIASSILIMLWVADELSYEKMHENADDIQLLYKQYKMGSEIQINSSLPYPLGQTLEEEIPEIDQVARVVRRLAVIRSGDESFNETTLCATDNSYFSLFSFTFLSGDPQQALTQPYSVVLTKEKAEKYFGADDPMGRTIEFDQRDVYTVTGVIENIKQNTYLNYDIIIALNTIYEGTADGTDWYSHFLEHYILINTQINRDSLNQKLTSHIRKYMGEDNTIEILSQPLTELRLKRLDEKNNRIQYIYIFSTVGLLIILIACINFMNVSTSLSAKRSREIAVRKVNGSGRKELIRQFMGEAFHQTLAAFIVAMMLVELVRPSFNQLTGKSIFIPYLDPVFIASLLGLLFLTTLLAGSYPALLLSSFKPITALQGKITAGKGRAAFRTALLVFQFSISIGLIIATLTIYRQLNYISNKNLGFEKENLVYLPINRTLYRNYNSFRNELLSHPGIINTCQSSNLPTSFWSIIRGLDWEGREDETTVAFSFASVDHDFIRTMNLQLLDGRDFSRQLAGDSNRVIINQAAAKAMGYDDPVGRFFIDDSSRTEIIGLIRDFHSIPLMYDIEPMLVLILPDYYNYVLIRLGAGPQEKAISHIEKTWKEFVPGFPFEINFVDERIDRQYRNELRVGNLSGAFTILAIIITCIGLFAVASHTALQKTKEIGIRKAMGASASSVVFRFIGLYLKWVLAASLIAWPMAWYFIRNWLNNFSYRMDISIWIFVMASVGGLAISVLTIAYHAWSVARSNPVHSLRYE